MEACPPHLAGPLELCSAHPEATPRRVSTQQPVPEVLGIGTGQQELMKGRAT
jgi:hypothetical protein